MTDLVFLLSADIDIQQACEYYENYQAGRGELFPRHLDAAVTHLRLFPKIAPVFHGNYRRLLVPRYPSAFSTRSNRPASSSLPLPIFSKIPEIFSGGSDRRSGT
jgi:hypothetical protein